MVVQGAQQAAPEAQAAALVGSPAAVQPVALAAALVGSPAAVQPAAVAAAHAQRPRIRRSPTALASVVVTPDGSWDSAESPC